MAAISAAIVLVVSCLVSACDEQPRAEAATYRALVVAVPPSTTSTSTTSTTLPTTTSTPPTTAPPTSAPPAPPSTAAAPAPTPPPPSTSGAYCIGDSVMLGAGPALFDLLSMCGTVDAVESRQMRTGGGAASVAASSGAGVVVVHLGTNGPVTAAHVDDVLGRLGGVGRVVLVTVQTSGLGHQSSANREIRAAAGRYGNVRIADWEAVSTGQPGYFAGDGIHLSRSGAQAFAQMLAGATG
jgi:lysophospholipase L1-like esterase